MNIRKLDQEEKVQTRPLYEACFSEDSKNFVDYYYDEVTKDNQIYAVEDKGAIQAMLHLNPYRIRVNGEENVLNYIVAVATKKEERKKGYMSALLKEALHDMYRDGKPFTYLMPAAESIYLPFDFRTVYRQEIPSFESPDEMKIEDCEKVADFAEEYLKAHYQVYTIRDSAYYEKQLRQYQADGGHIFLKREEQGICGVGYTYPKDESFAEEEHLIMVRIVDVKRMLMSMKLKTLTAACFTVTDPLLPENNCCLTITGTEFSGVLLMDGLEKNSEGVVTISALGELLLGTKNVDEICMEDGVCMSERLRGEFEKMIPLQKIYINELV